jgi:hypothetical protein
VAPAKRSDRDTSVTGMPGFDEEGSAIAAHPGLVEEE